MKWNENDNDNMKEMNNNEIMNKINNVNEK